MKPASSHRDPDSPAARVRRDISLGVEHPAAPSAERARASSSSGSVPARLTTVAPIRSRARAGRAAKHGILFLAANPRASNLLTLTEECAEIQRELKMTRHRGRFRFESRWAVGIDDLMRHLMELDPTVITSADTAAAPPAWCSRTSAASASSCRREPWR